MSNNHRQLQSSTVRADHVHPVNVGVRGTFTEADGKLIMDPPSPKVSRNGDLWIDPAKGTKRFYKGKWGAYE